MGPHSFKCGKKPGTTKENRVVRRFNGAALFQVRKGAPDDEKRCAPPALQWGRTLSSAESSSPKYRRMLRGELQWGRTLSSAERRKPNSRSRIGGLASMGPHSFKCGKSTDNHITSTTPLASMGPHSFKCGKNKNLIPAHLYRLRFNGAALFQVRKAPSFLTDFNVHVALQWGRTLSSAESRMRTTAANPARACFNGAALFQVRKDNGEEKTTEMSERFNGAALFQVRKD